VGWGKGHLSPKEDEREPSWEREGSDGGLLEEQNRHAGKGYEKRAGGSASYKNTILLPGKRAAGKRERPPDSRRVPRIGQFTRDTIAGLGFQEGIEFKRKKALTLDGFIKRNIEGDGPQER